MPTTNRDAAFLARMIRLMLAGALALVVGIFLDTPND